MEFFIDVRVENCVTINIQNQDELHNSGHSNCHVLKLAWNTWNREVNFTYDIFLITRVSTILILAYTFYLDMPASNSQSGRKLAKEKARTRRRGTHRVVKREPEIRSPSRRL